MNNFGNVYNVNVRNVPSEYWTEAIDKLQLQIEEKISLYSVLASTLPGAILAKCTC